VKDDKLYIIHIQESIELIFQYTTEGRGFFLRDRKTQDAVVRNLEIIGEAAKRVSEKTRSLSTSVQWKRIAGLRDVLIHQYEGVDLEKVWSVVEKELPILKESIRKLQ
jgi:uncharacterized protein with HEPN domain